MSNNQNQVYMTNNDVNPNMQNPVYVVNASEFGSGSKNENTQTQTVTVLAGYTTIVVAHTLGTASFINDIEPQDDLGGRSYWITTKTTTHYTLNISSMDMDNHVFKVKSTET
jgi:hypothetical protein